MKIRQRIKDFFTRSGGVKGNTSDGFLKNYLFGGSTQSGIYISEKTSLTLSSVWASVRAISETIGMLEKNVIETTADGRQIATSHPLQKIINSEPNNRHTDQVFTELLLTHVLLWGNAYAYIARDTNNRPEQLIIMCPWEVSPHEIGQEIYYYTPWGVFSSMDVLHIPGLGYDGVKGVSPIGYHRESLGLGKAAEIFGARFFNGTNNDIVYTHPGTMSPEAQEAFREYVISKNAGIQNSFNPMILEEGMKAEKMSIPPDDAQFLQTRQYSVNDVARIFRIQPHKIGDLSRSTNNNIEQQAIEYVTDTIQPWVSKIEKEYNKKLFRENEKSRYKVVFNVTTLLRGDTASRSEFYKDLLMIGVLSPNEIRRLENLNPIEGGDQHFIPLNMTNLLTPAQSKPDLEPRMLALMHMYSKIKELGPEDQENFIKSIKE